MVDYVVIGAGAAGCVLARRLVDAGSSVCLIEAGELRAHASNVDEIGGFTNLGLCTYSDEERFFSYRRTTHRRESDYGRLISAITLTP